MKKLLILLVGLVALSASPALASHVDFEPVVTKTYSPQPAVVGEPVTYHITFTNEGHTEMMDTFIYDIPDGNPELVSSTATLADGTVVQDACYVSTDPASGPYHFRCEFLGPLKPGEMVSVDITVIYREAGTFENLAEISWWDAPPPGEERTYQYGRENARVSVEVVEPAPPMPQTKADCKKGGYAQFGFDSQGECIAFVKSR